MAPWKVTVDGVEHEVEQSALQAPEGVTLLTEGQVPEGLMSKVAHEGAVANIRKSLEKRAADAAKGRYTPEEFLEEDNAEALQALLDLGGETLAARLKIEPTDVDIQRIREQVEKALQRSKIEPLAKDLEVERELVMSLLDRALKADVLQAARDVGGVTDGMEEFLVDRYRDLAGFSREHLGYFIKDGEDSFQINPTAGDGEPTYLPIGAHLKAKKAAGDWGAIFKGKTRDGVTIGDQSKGGPTKATSKSQLTGDKEKSEFITEFGLDAFDKLPMT